MRQDGPGLRFRPALPSRITRLTFRVRHRGARLRVGIGDGEARYALEDGDALTIRHEDEDIALTGRTAVVRPLAPRPQPSVPEQPEHRGPLCRDTPPGCRCGTPHIR
nr:glycosyl hydrolase family 65 protein [Pseudonocardia sp. MH-G8]